MIDLADVEAAGIALVGGKAAGLAEMIRAGERVPAGFCITTAAYDIVRASLRRAAGPGPWGDPPGLRAARAGAVAVRSSATAEDLPQASFAGQHETLLNVSGADALIDAVRRCWDSLTSERAVAYREAAGIADGAVRMGVVVQRMVDPVAAGVLFTANPITGTRTADGRRRRRRTRGRGRRRQRRPPTTTSSTGGSPPRRRAGA